MQLSNLVIGIAFVSVGAVGASPASDGKRTKPTQAIVDQIRKDCGITSQQFTYDDETISFKYDGMIEREKVDCARDRTILLGVGFDSYDLTAPYSGPRRFIIKGPPKRLEAVAAEASALTGPLPSAQTAGRESHSSKLKRAPILRVGRSAPS